MVLEDSNTGGFTLTANARNDIAATISQHVIKTFETTFGVTVEYILDSTLQFNDDDLISKIDLCQGDTTIELRFAFPRMLLTPLLQEVYGTIMASHEKVIEDAACEISNIICGGLKKHLNENGYRFTMSLPSITIDNFKSRNIDDTDHMNMNFLLRDDGFTVDLNLMQKR